ncbi:Bacterial regulatory protein, LysR domain protein, partial [Rhodopirellula maiorica SM1]
MVHLWQTQQGANQSDAACGGRLAVEFDQLTHFLKIVQTQNITRAAEELGLSQPAVSRSLQRLEDEIGQPLFERQSRKMML